MCEQAGLRWAETSITEIVTAHAARAVSIVPFTQPAEALSGADWVWWWVDGTSAYGMLVQAKRLTIAPRGWSFDFGYRTTSATTSQREVLRSAAQMLGLLPIYALYLGTGDYRAWAPCSRGEHQSERCFSCVRRTVSLMPALLADELIVNDATSTYERSVALEDLWIPPRTGAILIPALRAQLTPELSDFLETRQDGTRAVTRTMIDRVLRVRSGQFSAVSTASVTALDGGHDRLGRVFSQVPSDTGHWGEKYFEHVLAPLRHTPPGYVLEVITGDVDESRLASEMPSNVAGIVVVQVPRNE